jgi:hypothetical protein
MYALLRFSSNFNKNTEKTLFTSSSGSSSYLLIEESVFDFIDFFICMILLIELM